MKKMILFVFLYSISGLSFAADSYAAIYKYVDKNGIVCFADDLQSVPQNYRAAAVIVEGDAKEDPDTAPTSSINNSIEEQSVPGASPETPHIAGPRPLSFRLMVSAAISLSIFLIFMAITRQTRIKEDKKAQSLIRASFIALVSVYLIIAHVKDVITVFSLAGRTIDNVQQQSAEKGKKAAQAIKALDTMFEDAQKAAESSPAGAEDADKK